MVSKRSPKQKSKHDKKVENIATDYQNKGWKVYADIDGFGRPHERNGHIPDVAARRNKGEHIYEVETEDTVDTEHAKKQKQAFESYASKRQNAEFFLKVAK